MDNASSDRSLEIVSRRDSVRLRILARPTWHQSSVAGVAGIYCTAMPACLPACAASMLPGGLGSTEAAVGLSVSQGAIAAIWIRLATLWFAMFLGLFAMILLGYLTVIGRA